VGEDPSALGVRETARGGAWRTVWAAGRAAGTVVAMVSDDGDRIRMPTAALGAAGPVVSRVGLGLAALGRPAYITSGREQDLPDRSAAGMRARAFSVLDAAYAGGVRYVDAARSYGLAEEFLAGWLAERGHADVTVGSKWGTAIRRLAARRFCAGGQGALAGHVHDPAGAKAGPCSVTGSPCTRCTR